MAACAACSAENREGARFCDSCGAPLEAPARGEERKIVSVLFVDLVGSTAAADGADPEDVRATLAPYYTRVKQEIERFGGAVEKFVGDAVMAVFGAPVAHEDDAERAVRAGLRVLEACAELGVDARAAVNTGEALVALGARPEAGEALVAGDVVNTAARLQGEAEVGTLVAGELTVRTTGGAIEYEPLAPVEVKGKAGPVPLWRARGARSRFGVDLELKPATPFVGRAHELALLTQTHARTLRESAVQLVTITGEPGVGKTRLVTELRNHVDELAELVYWRQGRCLPYGEGITFWALGEIVKAHAGILDSDDAVQAHAKLAHAVAQVGDEPEREWLVARLAPLVGAGAEPAEREESFAAWRRFLEGVAAARPLVLVFEDLHWADDALIEFLVHLVDWTTDVPLLVVCIARPELYERHRDWGGGMRNSTTIALPPLDTEETSRLLAALLQQAVLPAETQALLLERAGGNPLYAEEFVRMLHDRGLLRRGAVLAEDIPVPESVHALIAARLDTLSPERKAVLQDAAVVGKVFWQGAVAAMSGGDARAAADALHELARKELVRPARVSSVEGELEFSFWHTSIREVAYGQIPRDRRAEKHRAAAAWIEALPGDTRMRAELLAYHYEQALELARAAGRDELAAELVEPTLRYLVAAAERLMVLDVAAADDLARRVLELAPEGHRQRLPALLVAGRAATMLAGSLEEAERMYREALEGFRRAGDVVGVGAALTELNGLVWSVGRGEESRVLSDEAIAVLEPAGATEELASAYASSAFRLMVTGAAKEALEQADRAIETARAIGSTGRGFTLGLQVRGGARCDLGDPGGLADLREALDAMLARGHGVAATVGYTNLADYVWPAEGPEAALEIHLAGIELAERRGLWSRAGWGRAETVWMLFELGRWDELLAVADGVQREADARGRAGQPTMMTQTFAGLVHAWRGDLEPARALRDTALPRARAARAAQVYAPALALAATIACLEVDRAAALELAREFADMQGGRTTFHGFALPDAVRAAVVGGDLELAHSLAQVDERERRGHIAVATAAAIVAEARGEREEALAGHRDAAERWREFGFVLEHALALLGAARSGGTEKERGEGEALLANLGVGADSALRTASAR